MHRLQNILEIPKYHSWTLRFFSKYTFYSCNIFLPFYQQSLNQKHIKILKCEIIRQQSFLCVSQFIYFFSYFYFILCVYVVFVFPPTYAHNFMLFMPILYCFKFFDACLYVCFVCFMFPVMLFMLLFNAEVHTQKFFLFLFFQTTLNWHLGVFIIGVYMCICLFVYINFNSLLYFYFGSIKGEWHCILLEFFFIALLNFSLLNKQLICFILYFYHSLKPSLPHKQQHTEQTNKQQHKIIKKNESLVNAKHCQKIWRKKKTETWNPSSLLPRSSSSSSSSTEVKKKHCHKTINKKFIFMVNKK